MKEFELERRILELRPDLTHDTVQNWSTGISGCTPQTKEAAMRDLLTYAKSGKPMPWETRVTDEDETASLDES